MISNSFENFDVKNSLKIYSAAIIQTASSLKWTVDPPIVNATDGFGDTSLTAINTLLSLNSRRKTKLNSHPTVFTNNYTDSRRLQGFTDQIFKNNLVIRPEVLEPGVTYIFTLECTYVNEGLTTTSFIEVVTNGPPSSGSLSVIPYNGTSMETNFEASAMRWVDDQIPLSYSFGYIVQTAPVCSWACVPFVYLIVSHIEADDHVDEDIKGKGRRIMHELSQVGTMVHDMRLSPESDIHHSRKRRKVWF